MKTKLNFNIIFIAIIIFMSNHIFAHFGSKGPFGGSVSCGTVYDTTVYIGTNNGGVFFSTKSALVGWSCKPVGLKSGKITALAHTGSYLFAATADSGIYIYTGFVGTDRYWKKINNGLTDLKITSLVAIDSITVLAGTNGGGIFKTVNKGANWIDVNNSILHHYTISGIVKAGSRVIHISDGGVWASLDTAKTWIDFNDNNTLHVDATALSLNSSTDELLISNAAGLYLAANVSTTLTPEYTAVNTGLPANTIVYSISNNGTNWYLATNKGVFTSPVGTISWTSVNTGLTTLNVRTVIPFQTRLVAGTDKEGLFKTSASSINWVANNTSYNNLRTYSMETSGAAIVIAATEKGVFVSKDLAATYKRANNGLTDSLHVNDLQFADFCVLAATQNAGVFFTADTGKTWIAINNGLTNLNIKKVFYSNNQKYAICSSGTVYVSALHSSTWTPIQAGLPSGVNPTSLTFIGTELVLGTYGHGVFTKNETSGSWTAVNTSLSNLNVTSVTNNGTKIFVGTDGSGVFVSDFPSVSWSQTSPVSISHTTLMGLNGDKIDAMAYNAGYIFASYRGGLLATSDNGTTWIAGGNQFNLPSYTSVNKITFVTTRVFVTTENNCLYSNALSELPTITTGVSELQKQSDAIVVYPNPVIKEFKLDFSYIKDPASKINIYDCVGKLIQSINPEKETMSINIPFDVAAGIYIIQVDTSKERFTQKIVKE
jgi:photosystem II stability/assembly factor-like uncharacterized protein